MRERHRVAIVKATECLADTRLLIDNSGEPDLVAAELRQATRAVDSIVGRVDVEDLLDEIFASFCIGK
jgi:tRNA modification GTPase